MNVGDYWIKPVDDTSCVELGHPSVGSLGLIRSEADAVRIAGALRLADRAAQAAIMFTGDFEEACAVRRQRSAAENLIEEGGLMLAAIAEDLPECGATARASRDLVRVMCHLAEVAGLCERSRRQTPQEDS